MVMGNSIFKLRYTVKRKNGHIFSEIFSLREIEDGYVKKWFENNHIGGADEIFKEQYAGLKEPKTEIKIFEGEKLYIAGVGICTVIFDGLSFEVETEKGDILELRDCMEDIEKIIGNIHEAKI